MSGCYSPFLQLWDKVKELLPYSEQSTTGVLYKANTTLVQRRNFHCLLYENSFPTYLKNFLYAFCIKQKHINMLDKKHRQLFSQSTPS